MCHYPAETPGTPTYAISAQTVDYALQAVGRGYKGFRVAKTHCTRTSKGKAFVQRSRDYLG